MIKAVIIDDEKHCIDRLQNLLQTYFVEDIILADCYQDITAGFKGIQNHKPDLIFLDVMIGNETGFDLLQKFEKPEFEVVFTTAHEHFALKAIKFSAIDYLLKPIDLDDLRETVYRMKEKKSNGRSNERLSLLFDNINNINKQNKKITIPTIDGLEVLSSSEIIRCNSDVNYTTIYSKNRKPFMVAKTLKDFEGMLTPLGFFRVHNSHLVNLSYVKSYKKSGYVELEDGSEVEVSSRRKDDFLKILSSL